MSHKILITGAGGYIGSVATNHFLQNNFEVVVTDNFKTGFKEPLQNLQDKFGEDKLRYYEVDIRSDLSEVLTKEKSIDAVVHYAGLIIVDESMKDPAKYFENNVSGSINLFSQLIRYGIKNIVFSSTAAVYGSAKYTPIDENHPTHPNNVYGQTKLMIEEVLGWYGKQIDVRSVILRYFNVCGASDDGSFGYSNRASTHLIANAVKGALEITPFYLTCPEVGTPDKTPVRDYVNVVDLAEAHLKAVNYLCDGGKSEIINLGTGTGNSVMEIVEKVQSICGKTFETQRTTPRQGEDPVLIASIEKAKQVLDWKPKHSITDSISSLEVWFKNHPNGWEY